MPTHKEAIQLVLDALVNEKTGCNRKPCRSKCSWTPYA